MALLPLFELLATNLTAITRGADGVLLPPATAMIDGIDVKMYAYYVALAASVAVFCLSIWISRRRSAMRSRRSAMTSRSRKWSASASFR